ncbi:MAG: glycosyltransferase [Acidobacteria bacterium]|nr:glycosyltransferase [Acidobacteriota bacterium]
MAEPGGRPGSRVAVVLTQLGYGGAERQTFLLLEALRGGPWEPATVVCMSDHLAPYGPALERLGYALEVLPRRSSFDVARFVALRRLLRGRGVRLVHAVHLLASGYAWTARGRAVVLPSFRGALAGSGRLRFAVYRRMLRKSPKTLVNSRRGAKFLVDTFGAPAERLVVIPNGLDFPGLRRDAVPGTLRAELGLGQGAELVGYVGKDSAVKNPGRFVEVVRGLLAARPALHAVLVGERLDEAARARLAPGLPPGRVSFLGPRGDVPSILADLDVLVLTSESEGCPNVVLEALGVGTPVVAADVGDVAEIMAAAPGGGAVVPRTEVEAYTRAIGEVLDLGATSRAGVRGSWPALDARFGLSSMVERTVALWGELLATG